MLLVQRIAMTVALFACTAAAQAAINNNPATHGQWKSNHNQYLSVGADGVKSYAFSEDKCRQAGHFSHTGTRINGQKFRSGMQSALEYHQELLPDIRDTETRTSLRDNIQTIQQALPLINGNQQYAAIEHTCGESNSLLLFVNAQTAIEEQFIGGETFYTIYRK